MATRSDDLKSSGWKLSDGAIGILERMFTAPDAYKTRAVGRIAFTLRTDKALSSYLDGIDRNYSSVKGGSGKYVRLFYRPEDLKFINWWKSQRRKEYKLTAIALIIGVGKAIIDGESHMEFRPGSPVYIGDDVLNK